MGPHVSDVDFSGTTITLTVTHDGGTTLNGFTSTPVDATASSGSNFFRCFDSNGIEIPVSTVQVTAADEITITLAFQPIANFTLYGGYGAMEGVTDTDTFITDGTLPLRTFSAPVTADLTNLTTNVVSIFSAEEDPENPGSALYFNNAAGTGATAWTKVAGAAGHARRDDTKPQPTWYANSNMGLSIPGVYFDASTSMKLLVDHALTGSSDYTAQ